MAEDGGIEQGVDGTRSNGGQQEQGQAAQGVISALFPAPPSQAGLYTRENIHRCEIVKRGREADATNFPWDSAEPGERLQRQSDLIIRADEEDSDVQGGGEVEEGKGRAKLLPVPDWDVLLAMEPPRVDWIEQDGFYSCFGETWPVDEKLGGLRERGLRQFYSDDCQDRRAVMVTLLRTLLKSFLALVDVILEPPQEYLATEQVPNSDQVIKRWRFVSQDKAKDIEDLSINFMHLLNEMRPLQAKEELQELLKRQLDRRREEASLIRMKCQAMRAELAKMREPEIKDSSTER